MYINNIIQNMQNCYTNIIYICTYVFAGNTPIEIKITNCQEPTYERLLRKLDGRLLRALKERMKADPIAPGIPPLALHCISVSTKSDFLPHLVNQYKFEVLGGLHSITAKKELLEEMPGT